MTIQAGQVFAMVPPAIPGLGASGGLQLQVEDRKTWDLRRCSRLSMLYWLLTIQNLLWLLYPASIKQMYRSIFEYRSG